jgi:hypothetical protein
VKFKIEKGKLIIEIALKEPQPSTSGRTLLVATSRGMRLASSRWNGKKLWVILNAFVFPDGADPKKTGQKRNGGKL